MILRLLTLLALTSHQAVGQTLLGSKPGGQPPPVAVESFPFQPIIALVLILMLIRFGGTYLLNWLKLRPSTHGSQLRIVDQVQAGNITLLVVEFHGRLHALAAGSSGIVSFANHDVPQTKDAAAFYEILDETPVEASKAVADPEPLGLEEAIALLNGARARMAASADTETTATTRLDLLLGQR